MTGKRVLKKFTFLISLKYDIITFQASLLKAKSPGDKVYFNFSQAGGDIPARRSRRYRSVSHHSCQLKKNEP